MAKFQSMMLLAVCGLALTGCSRKEYVFNGATAERVSVGATSDTKDYNIYTDQPSIHQQRSEDTLRTDNLPLFPPLNRSPARQKEVLTALMNFYEKLYNTDERRAKDSVKWLNNFLTEYKGLAPDQPIAIQSQLDLVKRGKERALKAMAETPKESEKAAIQEQIAKMEKDIEFFTKYVQERPTKAVEYQAYIDSVEAANKRMQIWEARHTRMTNTLEWVHTTSGNADAEINRAVREMSGLLTFNDDQTKMEAIGMAVSLGGTDAKQLQPRVKALADDEKINAEVRAFAATAAKSIEGQGG